MSKDIDFFIRDVQWLTFLTPRLNDLTANLATDYQEQANSLKLILPHGDIDFVAAASVTKAPATETIEFMGRSFPLEATEEILAKMLLYRAEYLKPRDVFDLVAVAETDPESAERAMLAAAPKKDVLARRLDRLDRLPHEQLAQDIMAIGEFAGIIEHMVQTAGRLLLR